jgi:SAM-dependent methyltransferase
MSSASLHLSSSSPTPDEGITYTEQIAHSRWGSYMTALEKKAILRAHDFSKTTGPAIEIGCEGGRWSKMLHDLDWKMTCVDIDAQALNICRARIPQAHCILTTPSDVRIPSHDRSMQLLLCMEVPAVLPNSNWIVEEACRVLKPGGILVGRFHNLLSGRGVFHHTTAALRRKQDDYRRLYPTWRALLRKKGFRFLHEEGLCWFPFRRASNSALVPKAIAFEEQIGLRRIPSLSPFVVFVARIDPIDQPSMARTRTGTA